MEKQLNMEKSSSIWKEMQSVPSESSVEIPGGSWMILLAGPLSNGKHVCDSHDLWLSRPEKHNGSSDLIARDDPRLHVQLLN